MDTEMLDIVLNQVEEATRSKFKVREMLDKFKADSKCEVLHASDPTPLDIFNIIESIKQNEYVTDKVGCGNDLLGKMLMWQYAFYELSKHRENSVEDLYLALYSNRDRMNQLITDELSDLSEDFHIPFKFDMSVPID